MHFYETFGFKGNIFKLFNGFVNCNHLHKKMSPLIMSLMGYTYGKNSRTRSLMIFLIIKEAYSKAVVKVKC